MQGPAYLVSHGGAAFPDLDLVLEGQGVRVILVGNTDIKNGITTTNFATTPGRAGDERHGEPADGSALGAAAFGDLCAKPLFMPTTITGQNGKRQTETRIGVSGCGVQIVGHKVIGNTAYLTFRTFARRTHHGSGRNVTTVYAQPGQGPERHLAEGAR